MSRMGTILSLEGQEREELDENNEAENQCTGETNQVNQSRVVLNETVSCQETSSGNSSEESGHLTWSLTEEIAKLKEPGQFVPASMVHSHLRRMQNDRNINCCRLNQALDLAVKKGLLIKAGSSLYSVNKHNLPREIVDRLQKVSGGENYQEGFSGWDQEKNLAHNNMKCLEWYLIRRGNGYGIYDESNEEPPKDCQACEKEKKMSQMRKKKDMKRKRSGKGQSEKKATKKMKYCNCIEPNNLLKKRGKRSMKRGRSRGRKKTPVTCMASLLDQQPIEDEGNEENEDDENEQESEHNIDNDNKESQEEIYSDEEENSS